MRYFVAVAEELHFGRAAQRLRIAQPALSRQIQALEKDLLVQLLFRNRRRVQITPAGQVFLERARLILARSDEAVLAAQRAGGGVSGALNLGFVGSATYDVLPGVLRDFLRAAPHVDLTLSEMTVHAQIEALTEKRIDIGLLRLPPKTEGLVFRTIAREPLYVALPSSHHLSKFPALKLAGAGWRALRSVSGPSSSQLDGICDWPVSAGGVSSPRRSADSRNSDHAQPGCRGHWCIDRAEMYWQPATQGRCIPPDDGSAGAHRIARSLSGEGSVACGADLPESFAAEGEGNERRSVIGKEQDRITGCG